MRFYAKPSSVLSNRPATDKGEIVSAGKNSSISGLVAAVKAKGRTTMKSTLAWLVSGSDECVTLADLHAQLEGAKAAHTASLARVEEWVARLDLAVDEAGLDAATDGLTQARSAVQRAAEHVARAERAIVRRKAADATARRAKLEQRKAELEATIERSRIDARTRPLEEEEFRLLVALVEVRSERVQLKRADCKTLSELVRTCDALGHDSSAVEMSLSSALSEPTHSHNVLQRLEALANSFAHDDPRRTIASDLSYAVVAPRVTVAAHRQAAE